MFDIPALLRQHVYTAIVLGSLVEGETTVVLAGFAAHRGYVPWWSATLLAAAVNFLCDQFYYLLGRWKGRALLARYPRLAAKVARFEPRVRRHRHLIIVGVRFMYGLRIAGPVALGILRISWVEYLALNAFGAIAWAVLFSALGYAFGQAIALVVEEVGRYELHALVAIAFAGVAYGLWRWVSPRRSRRKDRV